MPYNCLLVVLYFALFGLSEQTIEENHVKLASEFTDIEILEPVINQKITRSIAGCLSVCTMTASCLSFSYNKGTGQCNAFDSIFTDQNSVTQQQGNNWTYYKTQGLSPLVTFVPDEMTTTEQDEMTTTDPHEMQSTVSDEMTTTIPDEMTTTEPDEMTTTDPHEMTSTVSDEMTTAVLNVMMTTFSVEMTTPIQDEMTTTDPDEMTTTVPGVMTTTAPVEMTTTVPAICLTNVCYSYGSSFYLIVDSVSQWDRAQDTCIGYGGKLAEAETPEENTYFKSLFQSLGGDRYFIGGYNYNVDATFEWASDPNTPIGYSDWEPGQPNTPDLAKCLYSNSAYQYRWGDIPCTQRYPFICEL